MIIKKIRLENFTVFEKIEIDCCAGVNVFIGGNGTGKSHLLKLAYTFCEWGIFFHDGPDFDIATQPMLFNMFQGEDYDAFVRKYPDGSIARKPLVIAFDTNEGEYIHQVELFDNLNNAYAVPRYTYVTPRCTMVGESSSNYREPSVVFIPAKEMLSHAGIEKDYIYRNLPLDSTLVEILNKAGVSTLRKLPENMRKILERISEIIGGKVIYKNDRYFVKKPNGSLISFAVEAEGFKKLGLIYRLIETGYLAEGSTLFWDEPDANINPKLTPEVVKFLLELSRNDVQIFLTTHDYNLMKYFSMAKKATDQVLFHSLYKTENGVACDMEEDYDLLEHNLIVDANIKLLEDNIEGVV